MDIKLRNRFSLGALLAAFVLFVSWSAAFYQFGGVSNGARYIRGQNFVVQPSRIDVGAAARGEFRTATTTIRNLSFAPIRVIGVLATCNCLAVTGLPLTIEPRQSSELELRIHLGSASGEVKQMANILIDDGRMQRTPVVITGRCDLPNALNE